MHGRWDRWQDVWKEKQSDGKKWVLLAFGSSELKRDQHMHNMLNGINLLLHVPLRKSLKIHVLNDERID